MLIPSFLPFALMLHLIIAVFVYGDDTVLPSPRVVFTDEAWTENFHALLQQVSASPWDVLHLASKLHRLSSLPFFILLLAVMVTMALANTAGRAFMSLLFFVVELVTCSRRGKVANLPRSTFTGPYAVVLPEDKVDKKVDDARLRVGCVRLPGCWWGGRVGGVAG
jgi:hypothetical protein